MIQKHQKTFFIAEAGVNHNGCFDTAIELIRVAASAGADAVKFQTFRAASLAAKEAPKVKYQIETTSKDESQYEMLERLELPEAWHAPLIEECNLLGIEFMTTAFDFPSLAMISKFPVHRLKIPSGELVNGPLLWEFSRVGKPLILSTGMATLSEVELALAIINHGKHHNKCPSGIEEVWNFWVESGCGRSLPLDVSLLHCTSQYPAPESQLNIRAIKSLEQAFGLPVGYSDHSQGEAASIAAVAMGASIIEKHFTLNQNMEGPDHRASIEPQTLQALISKIRFVEKALGDGYKRPQKCEEEIRDLARQKMFVAQKISKGDIIEARHLSSKRSSGGMSVIHYWDVLGAEALEDLEPDTLYTDVRFSKKK